MNGLPGNSEKKAIYIGTVIIAVTLMLVVLYVVLKIWTFPAPSGETGSGKTQPKDNSDDEYKKIIEKSKQEYQDFMQQNNNRMQTPQ